MGEGFPVTYLTIHTVFEKSPLELKKKGGEESGREGGGGKKK